MKEAKEDQPLREFFKALKISLSNAAVYSPGHSVVMKSIEELRTKTDLLLVSYQLLEIFIAPKYLIVNGRKWENDPVIEDLAKFFHHRNIKDVRIKRGIDANEWLRFVSKASMRPKDILKEGGMEEIAKKESLSCVAVEMLDYSQILSSGKEDKDIWAYLLKDAVDKDNSQQIDSLVDYFHQMVGDIGLRDFAENEELQASVIGFFHHLKDKKDYACTKCSKLLLRSFLMNTDFTGGPVTVAEQLEGFFGLLSTGDLAEVLLDQLLLSPEPDLSFFNLFGHLGDKQRHQAIARAFIDKIEHKASGRVSPDWITKMVEAFQSSKDEIVAQIYAPVLAQAAQGMTLEEVFTFDRSVLPLYYRDLLLHLFAAENDEAWLPVIVAKTLKEWERIEPDHKMIYNRELFSIIREKTKAAPVRTPYFKSIESHIVGDVERQVLEGQAGEELGFFLDHIQESTLGPEPYLQKIFAEDAISPYMLKVFFKLFPDSFPLFGSNLKQRLTDTKYLLGFIKNVKGLEPPVALELLKGIYWASNVYIKIEVLKIMATLPVMDARFLLGLLGGKSEDIQVKEQTLTILKRDERSLRKALDILFAVPDSFGKYNAVLMENIAVVGRVGLKEARDHLTAVTKRGFPWNHKVRREAQKTLQGLGYG